MQKYLTSGRNPGSLASRLSELREKLRFFPIFSCHFLLILLGSSFIPDVSLILSSFPVHTSALCHSLITQRLVLWISIGGSKPYIL